MTEEALSSAMQLIQAVGYAMPVSKKGYAGLIWYHASDLQSVRGGAEASTAKFVERKAELCELVLKSQLLAEKGGRIGELEKLLDANTKRLELFKMDLEAKEPVLKDQSRNNGTLEVELKAARAAIGRGKRVIHDFAEHTCTRYTTLMRAQSSSYPDRLMAMLGDAEVRGEYLGGFRVCVRKSGDYLQFGVEDSDEERVGRTRLPESNDPRHGVDVVPYCTGPS